jgi:peptidyl-prolyl cis-trans isomerase D
MLTSLRKYTRGFVALLFIALIAVAFVIYEIRDIFSPQMGNEIAKGDGVEITPQEFNLEFQAELREQQSRSPDRPVTQRDLVDANIDAQILQGIINREARSSLASRLGFATSDQMVRNRLMTGFQNPVTGQFDKAEYEGRLRQMEITPAFYETFMRDELTRVQLERAMIVGVRAPSSYGRLIYSALSERRTVSATRIPASRVPAIADPSEADLTAWYANPPAQFLRPEQRSLTLFLADPAEFAPRVTLDEAAIAQQVEFEASRATTPEKRSYVQVSFGRDRAKAEQAAARLQAGAAPEAVAAELGGQSVPFSDVIKAGASDPAIAEAVFAAPAPGVIGVVDSPLGFSAVRLTAITPASVTDRAALTAKVRTDLTQRAVEEMIQKAVDEFQEARANGDDAAKAAAAAGLKVIAVPAVDARGLDDAGQPVPALQGFASKVAEAFKTPEGESTMFEAAPDRRWASAQVEGVRAGGIRPLGEVRAQAITVYKAQKRSEALTALADGLIAQVAAGTRFADAVRAAGLPLELSGQEFNRESIAQSPFAPLSPQLFSIRAGEAFKAPAGDSIAIFHIDTITRADPSVSPGVVEQRRQQATGVLQETIIEASSSLALSEANVRINQPRLDALVGRTRPDQGDAR